MRTPAITQAQAGLLRDELFHGDQVPRVGPAGMKPGTAELELWPELLALAPGGFGRAIRREHRLGDLADADDRAAERDRLDRDDDDLLVRRRGKSLQGPRIFLGDQVIGGRGCHA